jgi:CBS-domain-containing membrane protein
MLEPRDSVSTERPGGRRPSLFSARLSAAVLGGAGAALAIGAMESSSPFIHTPLAAIPFATSIVLVMGSPDAAPAQPRALIGGHLISTVVGFVVLAVAGPHAWAAAVAVGLAVIVMILTDTLHPPAGINPLLVVTQDLPWPFILVPVLAGALALALFAFAWHRLVAGRAWPRRPS